MSCLFYLKCDPAFPRLGRSAAICCIIVAFCKMKQPEDQLVSESHFMGPLCTVY